MSTQRDFHGYGGTIVWIVLLVPILYAALYFPLLSLAVRLSSDWPMWGLNRAYAPLGYLPDSVQAEFSMLWRRMDPEGLQIVEGYYKVGP